MGEFMIAYFTALCVVFVCVTLLWGVSLWLRDASIIDIFWGFGFVLCNLFTLALMDGEPSSRQWLVHGMVTLWGLRLTMHLWVRNTGHGEDPRYIKMRQRGGEDWWLTSYYQVFLLQGGIMLVVGAPIIVVNLPLSQAPLGWLDLAGCAIWLAGFVIEAAADQQLVVFKRGAENRQRVMQTGLWRYSVHPNYFGDATQWWGIWLVVASAPYGGVTVIGPLAMTAVFLFLTRELLERPLTRSRPGYAEYLARTSRFVLLPPKRSSTQG